LQEIHRDEAVRQPRAHPADGVRAFVALDRRRDVRDQLPLLVLAEVALLVRVRDAMPEDLVAALPQPRGDVGRDLVDLRVHLRLGRNAELVEQLEQPPDPDPIAVVAPAEDAVALRLVGRRDGRALPDAKAERLDVERDVDGETTTAGPGVIGTRRDVRVVVSTVRRQHDVSILPVMMAPRGTRARDDEISE